MYELLGYAPEDSMHKQRTLPLTDERTLEALWDNFPVSCREKLI